MTSDKHFLKTATVMAFAFLLVQKVTADTDEVAAITAKAIRLTQNIHSIEFTAFITTKDTFLPKQGGTPTERIQKSSIRYFDKNGHFRAEVKIEDPKNGKGLESLALYNGKRYQYVDKKRNSLSLSNSSTLPNASFEVNPLILPYYFLWDQSTIQVWSATKIERNWDVRLEKAKYIGEKTEGQTAFDVVEIPGPVPSSLYRVFFSKELEFYPLKIDVLLNKGESVGSIKVLQHIKLLSLGETVVVPLAIDVNEQGEGKSTEIQYRIEPKTLKVNEPIEEDIFTYPASQAESIYDVDENNRLVAGNMVPTKTHLPAKNGERLWLVLAGALVVLVVVVVIALARTRRKWTRGERP